jgi:hypothetical protein
MLKLRLFPYFSNEQERELRLLISDLTNMKNKFIACGHFDINLRYFYSVISLSATYVIIMSGLN